jgi:hypothetical protein
MTREIMKQESFIVKTVANIHEEYMPFPFQGMVEEGFCYLKISAKNDQCLILCAQLPMYLGTDVTSGFTEIFSQVVKLLGNHKQIDFSVSRSDRGFFSNLKNIFTKKSSIDTGALTKENAMIEYLRNATWIVCYPPGVGLLKNESFALVKIDEQLEQTWKYSSKSSFLSYFSLQDNDLNIDYEKLLARTNPPLESTSDY